MATEHEANLAREQYSQFLTELGAHAIAVDEVKRGGDTTFGVIAYCESKPSRPVPKSLEVKKGKETLQVPLAIRVMEKFKPD